MENDRNTEYTKKLNDIKKLYHISGLLFSVAIILWIVVTIVFLIIEGWHWKSVSLIEVSLDFIAAVIYYTAMMCCGISLLGMHNLLIKILTDDPE